MEAALFKGLVQVESNRSSLPAAPERAISRTYPAAPPRSESIELERINRSRIEGHTPSGVSTPGPATPGEERDLEMSRPASPLQEHDGVNALQSLWNPYMNRFRMLAVCLIQINNGLQDGASGPLIPYIEKEYNIGYAIVSLIFVGNAMGFLLAAPVVDAIRARFGRAKTLALSEALMAVGYIPLVSSAPFALIVVGFFFIGFGMAMTLAMGNVFAANLQNGTTMLGAMHGSYGIGGTVGPLIATAVANATAGFWGRYYLLTLGLAIFNLFFSAWSFWSYEEDLGPQVSQLTENPEGQSHLSAMRLALRSKIVLLGAFFLFAYQGAEVSISGWVISFLITMRNGDPASIGYVTAGFWAGITLGRFLLSPMGHKMGEKTFVYLLMLGAALFQLLVWFVPNIIGNGVAVSIVGLLLGPIYPCAAAVMTANLSRREQVSGLSVVSAFGSSGGAVAPFTTGILAQVAGTFVLHPVVIGLLGVMTACWWTMPGIRKRTE